MKHGLPNHILKAVYDRSLNDSTTFNTTHVNGMKNYRIQPPYAPLPPYTLTPVSPASTKPTHLLGTGARTRMSYIRFSRVRCHQTLKIDPVQPKSELSGTSGYFR